MRRYYQITDANYASEGFSVTWWPHLWRIKCEPLVNTQEFADILNQPFNKDNYLGDWDPTKEYIPGYTISYGGKIYTPKVPGPVPPGTLPTDPNYWEEVPDSTLGDLVSTYKKNIEINDKLIEEAKRLVPKQGYQRQQLYVVPTFTNGEPGLPSDVVIDAGVPAFPTGPVIVVAGTATVRIPANNPLRLAANYSMLLEPNIIMPEITDTNSGPVEGEACLCCDVLGPNIGPYGTADITSARADQYVSEVLTAVRVPVRSTVFSVEHLPEYTTPQLLVSATLVSSNGTRTAVFSPNTRIVSVDVLTKTITVDKQTRINMPAGTPIVLNSDFEGVVTNNMDYRTDSDPRFRFIRRDTPRSFGWLAGYNTGDGTAPNGIPLERGIAFPVAPKIGDYFLRTDYLPQKLYRYDGVKWVEISRNVRTATGFGIDDESQLSTFINNTATVATAQGTTIPSRQSLSKAFSVKPD